MELEELLRAIKDPDIINLKIESWQFDDAELDRIAGLERIIIDGLVNAQPKAREPFPYANYILTEYIAANAIIREKYRKEHYN